MSTPSGKKSPETFRIGEVDGRKGWEFNTGNKLGHGSFGTIYLGTNLETGEKVAVKVESSRAKHPQLAYEAKIYQLYKGQVGFPEVHYFGKEFNRNTMVMQLCGKSLEDKMQECGGRVPLGTVLLVGDQLLRRLETIHSRGFLHRDVKPENFLVGLGDHADVVYVIDFGLAKKYFDVKSRRHLPYRQDKSLTGTARYASVNAHAGAEQSRRDDLESLGYVLLYLLRGNLPWQGLQGQSKEEKYARIMQCKQGTPLEELCTACPREFVAYMRYCRSLGYEEVPNYSSLRKLFRDLREQLQITDKTLKWTKCNNEEASVKDDKKKDEVKHKDDNNDDDDDDLDENVDDGDDRGPSTFRSNNNNNNNNNNQNAISDDLDEDSVPVSTTTSSAPAIDGVTSSQAAVVDPSLKKVSSFVVKKK